MLASKAVDVQMILTDDLSNVYRRLSLDDKERINRIILARVRHLNKTDLQALRIEDEFYYQDLTSKDRFHMDNLVTRYIQENDLAMSIRLNAEDKAYYQSLTVELREKTDYLIATRVKQANAFEYIPVTYNRLNRREEESG